MPNRKPLPPLSVGQLIKLIGNVKRLGEMDSDNFSVDDMAKVAKSAKVTLVARNGDFGIFENLAALTKTAIPKRVVNAARVAKKRPADDSAAALA